MCGGRVRCKRDNEIDVCRPERSEGTILCDGGCTGSSLRSRTTNHQKQRLQHSDFRKRRLEETRHHASPMSLCLATRSQTPAPPPTGHPWRHVKCPPSPGLASFVDHYWVTRWDRRGLPPRAAASLLDPCVHLQIIDGRAHVLGVVRTTFRMRIEGVGCVVGVKFRPGGFYPFVQQSVARFTDRAVPATEVKSDSQWLRKRAAHLKSPTFSTTSVKSRNTQTAAIASARSARSLLAPPGLGL